MAEILKGEVLNGVLYLNQTEAEQSVQQTQIEKVEPNKFEVYTINQDTDNPNTVFFYSVKSETNRMPVIRQLDFRTYAPDEVVDLIVDDPKFLEYFNTYFGNSGFTKLEVVGKLPADTAYADGTMYVTVSGE